jgi:hypothetical protein
MTSPVSRLPLTSAHIAVLQARPAVKAAAPVAPATRKPAAPGAVATPPRPAVPRTGAAAAPLPASTPTTQALPPRPLQRGSLLNILA